MLMLAFSLLTEYIFFCIVFIFSLIKLLVVTVGWLLVLFQSSVWSLTSTVETQE